LSKPPQEIAPTFAQVASWANICVKQFVVDFKKVVFILKLSASSVLLYPFYIQLLSIYSHLDYANLLKAQF